MKKTPIAVTLSLLVLTFTLRESSSEFSASSDNVLSNQTSKIPIDSLAKYVPNLRAFYKGDENYSKNLQYKSLKQKVVIPNLETGSRKDQLGVSNNPDMQRLGPGAFLYLKKSKVFVILDNENNRLSIYPRDPSKKPYSIKYPEGRQALGLSANDSEEISLLSRKNDPSTGVSFPYYEIWSIDQGSSNIKWGKKTNFSFSDRQTHGAAQSLDMQNFGDSYLFKGVSENEFHILKAGTQVTQKISGYPTNEGSFMKAIPSSKTPEESKILLQEFDNTGSLKTISTQEDMTRLNSYRVLKNGLIALDLEADTERAIPRELILIDRSTGELKARSTLRPKDNIYVDQDLFYGESSIFQLADSDNSEESLQILQTELERE